jgi:hypothetical protein
MDKCYFCNTTPYGKTNNIAVQQFNDKTISSIRLNPYNTKLLTAETCNIPDKGANLYTVIGNIKYCPMCGRNLEE